MRRPYGHATVEEHPKGSGRHRVRARIHGRLRTVSPPGLSLAEANEHARAYVELRSETALREGITLAQFGTGFLDRRERRKVRSIVEDRNRWKSYVEAKPFGRIAIGSLRRSDVVEWRDALLNETSARGRRGLGPQTVKNALSLLRSALSEALDRELVAKNVAEDVKLPPGFETTQKLGSESILLPSEQEALLAAVPEHQRSCVLFALALGVRWSEASWLRWEDVGEDHVVIRRSRAGLAPKSGIPRKLPLPPPARIALAEARARRKGSSPWVFPGPRKGGPRKQAPSQWHDWVARSGVTKHITFHDVRHTTATSLLGGWWGGEKWTLEEVRYLLGHSSIKVTERYARLLDDTLELAAQRSTFNLFPGGNESGVSMQNPLVSNAFVNRRSRVQISKPAPQLSSAIGDPPDAVVGTKRERSGRVAEPRTMTRELYWLAKLNFEAEARHEARKAVAR